MEFKVADSPPLPTSLAGTSVKIIDSSGAEHLAPLFFVSPGQINYQMPPEAADGTALVTVVKSDHSTSTGTAQVTTVSPGIFSADATGSGYPAAIVLRVKADQFASAW